MSDKFQVTYYVDDGYVNPGPKHFTIHACDLEEDMDVEELLDDEVQNAFEQNVHPYVRDEQRMAFVVWAREQLAKADEEDSE